MSLDLEVSGLGLRYDDGTDALRGIDLAVPAGTILGLLGRNGAGKSSLMALVASLRRPTAGRVLVGGADPWEDASRTSQVFLVGEAGDAGSWTVRDALRFAGVLHPSWDDTYAERLVDLFALPATRIDKLSRGKRAALMCVLGLAARAPITMFDEPHLGMDAPTRYAFYDEVLSDYMAHPRTIVLSTHHIDEVASLFGQVAIIDEGRLVTHDETDALRARGTEITGPTATVDEFTHHTGLRVLSTRELGGTKAAVTYGDLTDEHRHRAVGADLELSPIPLQDLFVHLTTGRSDRQEATP